MIALSFLALASTTEAASEVKVPRLKAVSVFNHPVVHQTKPMVIAKSKKRMLVKRNYIARWGTSRFEYGEFVFKCDNNGCEPWKDRTVIAMYKSCEGLGPNGEANCHGLVAGEGSPTQESGKGRHWYTCDDYDQSCKDQRNDVEYPDRHSPEDSEMPGNMPI